jgi:hypothetical protein
MSGFRPVIRFAAARPRVTTALAAAAATATVLIAAAPGASAATVTSGSAQVGLFAANNLPASPLPGGSLSAGLLKASHAKVSHAKASHAKVSQASDGKASDGKAKTGSAKPGEAKPSHAKPSHAKANKKANKTETAAAVQQNYTFYDSTTPSQIPAHQQVATYADGHYAVERSLVSDPDHVIWIDTNGRDANANALDVEPGDAAASSVASWVDRRLSAHPGTIAIVYTMRSDWAAAKASVSTLPAGMRSQVRWWIADPTGHPHVVPGAQATQWYWGANYDISTAEPGF